MATIAELVDAIDGFVDNRTTVRDILIGQIKGIRDLREVRRARTQLQTDLGQEQRRRYDAEAERDLTITRKDLAEGAMDRVVGDLQQLRANAQSQINRMLSNITGKRTCIGVLLQKKFALQLLYQRNARHLQRSRRNIGLLEFN
ncbi:hypothetical protein RhiirC2_831180 [Rhizophagus irregularis]|uniref:Uncharacterized protein n=1 Tax=Rhizophagus irregularis TaxID=588596 RepID=A0A2N1M2D2_9GLOM|nr:hypothetical protein RhiirC2_831180 [Rhizophagus irregularis]